MQRSIAAVAMMDCRACQVLSLDAVSALPAIRNNMPSAQWDPSCVVGKCRSADGSKYEGAWKAGRRHGQGVSIFENGDQYKGGWGADAQLGQGICAYANGVKYQGKHIRMHGIRGSPV